MEISGYLTSCGEHIDPCRCINKRATMKRMPGNKHPLHTPFILKCILAGVACIFLLFETQGTSIEKAYGAGMPVVDIPHTAATIAGNAAIVAAVTGNATAITAGSLANWFAQKAFALAEWVLQKIFYGTLLLVAIAVLGRLAMWLLYVAVISVITPFVNMAIGLIESSLSPTVGSIAYSLFYSPNIQSAIYSRLWVPSRDLVNVVFALLLVIGAIMTIVKANKEFIQPYAAKFIVALILVNFSWFIPRVILDVALVGTKTITSLPIELAVSCNGCKTITSVSSIPGAGYEMITPFVYIKEEIIGAADGAKLVTEGLTHFYGQILKTGQNFTDVQAIFINPLLDVLTLHLPTLIKETARIMIGLFFIMFATGAYFVAIAALALAFLIRIPLLWLTVGFMPFVALGFAADFLKPFTGKIWNAFLSAAFMPVLAALPLTAGYMILMAVPGGAGVIPATTNSFIDLLPILLPIILSIVVLWMGVFFILQSDQFMPMGKEIMGKIKKGAQTYGKIGAFYGGAGTAAVGTGFGLVLAKRPLQALGKTEFGKKWLGADKINAASALSIPAKIMKARRTLGAEQIWANIKAGKNALGGEAMTDTQAKSAADILQKDTALKTILRNAIRDGDGTAVDKVLDTIAKKIGNFDRETTKEKMDVLKKIVAAAPSLETDLGFSGSAKDTLRQNFEAREATSKGPSTQTAGSTPPAPANIDAAARRLITDVTAQTDIRALVQAIQTGGLTQQQMRETIEDLKSALQPHGITASQDGDLIQAIHELSNKLENDHGLLGGLHVQVGFATNIRNTPPNP